MTGRRIGPLPALVVPVAVALAIVGVLAGPSSVPTAGAQATPQAQNRAAVIVHTGGGSRAVCVRFDEAAISGLDALQRAGVGAVVRGFSGQGAAVCAINGVGCPADNSCLSCQAPNYWAYHRAGPGAGGFSFSSVGAGSTQVVDGSVEGWQWGTGAAPPFQTVDQVCGPREPPPPPPPATPAPPPAATPGGSPDGGAVPPGQADPGANDVTTVAPTTTVVTTTTERGGEQEGSDPSGDGRSDGDLDGELAATSTDTDGGSSPWAVGAFTVLVLGVGGAAWVVHRRRSAEA